jgi:hypothetical protein
MFRNVVVAGSNRYDAEQGKKAVVVVVVVEALKEWAGDGKGRVGLRIVGRQRWEESCICVGLFGDDDDDERRCDR